MSKNYAISFDLETGSADPYTTQICSIGAVAIDMNKLEIVTGSEFHQLVKPEDESLIQAEALAVNKLTLEELRKAPSEKIVWEGFVDYVKKYRSSNTHWGAPMFTGFNIINFDLVISDRMAKKYKNVDKDGRQNIWHRRDQIDMIHQVYCWLGHPQQITSISFDNVREFLGMKPDQAHNAVSDAKDAAKLFIRFFKLYKELSNRIPFKGAFANE